MDLSVVINSTNNITASILSFTNEMLELNGKMDAARNLSPVKRGKKLGKWLDRAKVSITGMADVIKAETPNITEKTREYVDSAAVSLGMQGAEGDGAKDLLAALVELSKHAATVSGQMTDIAASLAGFPPGDWLTNAVAQINANSAELKKLSEYINNTIEEIKNPTDDEE